MHMRKYAAHHSLSADGHRKDDIDPHSLGVRARAALIDSEQASSDSISDFRIKVPSSATPSAAMDAGRAAGGVPDSAYRTTADGASGSGEGCGGSEAAEGSGGVDPQLEATEAAAYDVLNDIERYLGDLDRPFPWDEVEWNRCALQLSTQTGLDEIHNLFTFMSIGQVWITSGGQLRGVVTDRALIAACLHSEEQAVQDST